MSDGDLFQLTYVLEAAYKKTPADDDGWSVFRCTGDNISDSPSTQESDEISGAAVGIADTIYLGLDVAGDIPIEFSASSYDAFLEAAMGGAWEDNVLKGGTAKRSFTLQGYQPDLKGDKYIYRTGSVVNAVSLEFNTKATVTGSVGFICGDSVIGGSDLVGAGSEPVKTTTSPLKTGTSISNIRIGADSAASLGVRVKSIKLNIGREQEGEEQLDQDGFGGMTQKTLRPEITVEMYFDSYDQYKKMLNQEEFSFGWDVTDGTTTYDFFMARCKISGGAPDGAAKGAGRMHTWTAIGHSDPENTPLRITKS